MFVKQVLLLAALLGMWPARRLASLLLGTILLIGTTPVRALAQTKIMPLGDSITFGYNAQDETHGQDGGYRFPLSQLLISAGLNFNFVGSQNNGPANWPYNSHEGHPGACIVDIANGITPLNQGGQGWLGLTQPDIILLMIGTNDINQTHSYCGDVSTAPARLQALLAQIFYLLPNVQLMVASIPPFLDHEVAVANYNASVKSIVNQYTSQGRPITFVDVNSALTENDLAIGDPIHPSDEGYQKIADKWVCAISGLCVPGWTLGWSMNGVTATGLDYFPQSGQSGGVGSLRLVGAADLNGDGHSDFIWQDTATGDISYWLMNGTTILDSGYFPQGHMNGDLRQWRLVGIADLNGDGNPDLLWQEEISGDIYYWLMNGTQMTSGGYFPQGQSGLLTGWELIGAADLNRDGHPDLLWQETASGNIYYWIMNGVQMVQGGYFPGAANGLTEDLRLVGTMDVNGDGLPDLLWQEITTGKILYWIMSGTQMTSSFYFPQGQQSGLAGWNLVGPANPNGGPNSELIWQLK
jgi:lysophospholipase L1-like esterase